MSLETGIVLAILVIVIGAGGLTAFAVALSKREQKEDKEGHPLHHA